MKRKMMVLALVTILVLVGGAPALADVEESGSLNCGSDYVAVASYSVGNTWHYAPSQTQIGFYPNNSWLHKTTPTFFTSTSWRVATSGSLNDAGTYAFCWGTR